MRLLKTFGRTGTDFVRVGLVKFYKSETMLVQLLRAKFNSSATSSSRKLLIATPMREREDRNSTRLFPANLAACPEEILPIS
jgi:hypothetical protein